MARLAVSKLFEREQNTSRFKPQKTYEKILIMWMIFGSKFLSRF